MAHEQLGVGWQLALRPREVVQPLIAEAIREIGVHVVVDEVAGKDARPCVRLEHPPTVVWRLTGAHIDDAEGRAANADAVAVLDPVRGERPGGRPFVPEHRPQDPLLVGVVSPDDIVHAADRVHRHVRAADRVP